MTNSTSAKGFLILFACGLLPCIGTAQTARDYFNELKAARALNRYADQYVCFADDNIPSFAVIAKVNDLIEDMKRNGDTDGVKTLTSAKNGLIVQGYYKGVKSGEARIFDTLGTDDTDYVMEFVKPFHGKASYSINWATGRYRYQIFDLTRSRYSPDGERAGKCELIHPRNDGMKP
jgi:hypothetical protein